MKTHHKVIIGGVSTIVVIYMIVNGFFVYLLVLKLSQLEMGQQGMYKNLTASIQDTRTNFQSQVNDLSSSIAITKQDFSTQLKELKASASSDFSSVIESSLPAVVTIRTDVAQGTGFIINSEGYAITNAHVLSGGRTITAITSNQEQVEAELIGWSADYDIALIKIKGTYKALTLGDSNDIQTGEKVIAIGNPIGLQFSASEGIVSAVHRKISDQLGSYIQTDAALNPGNSGGPLINKNGQVIGINNFKVGGYESLGFALESNNIRTVVNAISQEQLNQAII